MPCPSERTVVQEFPAKPQCPFKNAIKSASSWRVMVFSSSSGVKERPLEVTDGLSTVKLNSRQKRLHGRKKIVEPERLL
jgi:hypothetical protein